MKKQMTEAEWQKVYDMSKDKNLYHNHCSSLFPTIHGIFLKIDICSLSDISCSFSALTLLFGIKERHLACKKLVVVSVVIGLEQGADLHMV